MSRIITLDDLRAMGPDMMDVWRYTRKHFGDKAEYADVHAKLIADGLQDCAYWLYYYLPDKTDDDLAVICGEQWPLIRDHLQEIRTMPWLDGHGPEPEGVRMCTAHDAVQGAARDAAWRAAIDDAHDAVQGAARGAACEAAWGAAREAVCDAARGAARGAVRTAACDAALYACILICDGLPLAQEHIDHIRKRWSVWQAGYGVLCDIDGELYCYRRV